MLATPRLSLAALAANVLAMYAVARLLQMIGLTIPLLAIFAQLSQAIDVKQMLGFLVAAIAFFGIGYVLQRYSGGK